jgi:carboxylesterase
MPLFATPEHQPFLWPGGRPAAVLVHGFPGTPAEMRPLASALHDAGWTVQGLLLPGFGSQIATLVDRHPDEWIAAACDALDALQPEHHPLLLVGYSLGGAVSLLAAAHRPPDALALLAPFWRLELSAPYRAVWFALRHLFPSFQPFARANFASASFRRVTTHMLPDIELGDPDVQQALREMRVRAQFVEDIRTLGRRAYDQAPRLGALPVLVVQGVDDRVVRPARTRALVARLPGAPPSASFGDADRMRTPRYVETPGGHHFLHASDPAWPAPARALGAFAAEVAARAARATTSSTARNSTGRAGPG